MNRNLWMVISTLSLSAALTAPSPTVAQSQPAAQQESRKHHHYKLEVIPSLGGQQTNFFDDANNIAVLNNRGTVSGGQADTSIPDIVPYYAYGDNGMVARAYVWENGAMTDLGAVADNLSSYSSWISSKGIVAGVSEKAEFDPLVPGVIDPSVPDLPEETAVVWRNGKITDLGFLPGGGYESRAVSVNNRGEVVGSASNLVPDANSFAAGSLFLLVPNYPYQSRAFFWDAKGGMQDLGTLGTGLDAAAWAINEQGQVIGFSYRDQTTPGGCGFQNVYKTMLDTGAFIWDKRHGMRDLGNFGGTCTFANAINNHGQVVGASNGRAFLWEDGVLRDLGGSLGGNDSTAIAINEKGESVGRASLADGTFHAALWRGVGQLTDLGTVDSDLFAFAQGVNDKAQIVGDSSPSDPSFNIPTRAFLWENGSIVDLNTLIPPNSPLYLEYAYTINNRGEIAGNGYDAVGNAHGFVLIPCDEDHPNIAGCDYSMK